MNTAFGLNGDNPGMPEDNIKPLTEKPSVDNEMIMRVAKAMQQRAKEPLYNVKSLEPVLVGSLGDAWPYLARAAIEAMREPTDKMKNKFYQQIGTTYYKGMIDVALEDEILNPHHKVWHDR